MQLSGHPPKTVSHSGIVNGNLLSFFAVVLGWEVYATSTMNVLYSVSYTMSFSNEWTHSERERERERENNITILQHSEYSVV